MFAGHGAGGGGLEVYRIACQVLPNTLIPRRPLFPVPGLRAVHPGSATLLLATSAARPTHRPVLPRAARPGTPLRSAPSGDVPGLDARPPLEALADASAAAPPHALERVSALAPVASASSNAVVFLSVLVTAALGAAVLVPGGAGDGESPGVAERARAPAVLALWAAFAAYAFTVAPPSSPLDLELVKAIVGSTGGAGAIFFAIFNALGIMPAVYGALLLPGGKDQRPLPATPFVAASFFAGFFALGPYLALREWRPTAPAEAPEVCDLTAPSAPDLHQPSSSGGAFRSGGAAAGADQPRFPTVDKQAARNVQPFVAGPAGLC